jgi:hypothetical protein
VVLNSLLQASQILTSEAQLLASTCQGITAVDFESDDRLAPAARVLSFLFSHANECGSAAVACTTCAAS